MVQSKAYNTHPITRHGIWYKERGEIKHTPPRERITNLDELPYPARHLLNIGAYRPSTMHYKKLPAYSIMCGRGCPHQCTFCDCPRVFGRKVVLRSPGNVAGEVAYLVKNFGAKEIMFWDDTFCLSKKWVLKICELIKSFNIIWSVWSRVDTVDREMLEVMADAGCWNISFGIEAGTQKVLDTIKKGITLEQAKKAIYWSHEAGIEARTTWILGLPGDDWERMMKTIEFAIEIDADYAQFQLLTIYPNTELWDTWSKYGTFLTRDWSKYTIWHPVFIPHGLSETELIKAQYIAYKRFYLRPRYLFNRILKIKNITDIKRYLRGTLALMDFF
jgi:radical SAM superfamily enzyme YgiQ (UPF0313 family)